MISIVRYHRIWRRTSRIYAFSTGAGPVLTRPYRLNALLTSRPSPKIPTAGDMRSQQRSMRLHRLHGALIILPGSLMRLWERGRALAGLLRDGKPDRSPASPLDH